MKAFQAHYANAYRGVEIVYKVGDCVTLLTFHRQKEYHKKGDKQAAKFFP